MLLALQLLNLLTGGGGGGSAPVFSGTIANIDATESVAISSLDTSTYFSNTPTSYAITGTLPTGLSFDTGTGILSGTPTLVGSFAGIYVTATNASGSASSNTFTITVASAASFGSGAGRKRDGRRRGMISLLLGRG